nr:TIGR02186 family protein [uncultured Gellertiella sp.]
MTRFAPRLTSLGLLAATLLALLPAGAGAQPLTRSVRPRNPEKIEIGMNTSQIAITPDFAGVDLAIFGAVVNADELLNSIGQYDIVVTLEGPKDDATVRRKERVFGVWVNRYSMTFEQVPQSYTLSSTRKIEGEPGVPALDAPGIGIDHIGLIPAGYMGSGDSLTEFRNAYRRLKKESGLYQPDPGGVRFISSTLFQANLKLPANIPNGTHTVHAALFKSGKFIMEKTLPLRVVKTGLEQSITDAAHEQPLLYGMASVLLAVFTGWGASVLFRRD